MNTHTAKPKTRKKTECRVIAMTINHHRGFPLCVDLDPELEGCLPVEQAMLAVGVRGEDPKQFARMGIYSFGNGKPSLKYTVDFDVNSGMPKMKHSFGRRDAEIATISWMQGAIFNDLKPGIYDLCRTHNGRVPRRVEFAVERTPSSAAANFDKYMSLVVPGPTKFQSPTIIPLLDARRLPGDPAELPVNPFNMTGESFRRHAVNKFVKGLHSAAGEDFPRIKAAFVRQFTIADSVREQGGGSQVALQAMNKSIDMSTRMSMEYIRGLKLDQETETKAISTAMGSISMLETYYGPRNETGSITMYSPAGSLETGRAEKRLFATPDLVTVCGAPVQVVDNVLTDGAFPDDGIHTWF